MTKRSWSSAASNPEPRVSRKHRTVSIHCQKCRTLLYKYSKGGTGGLVKCFLDRILSDHTEGDLCCPQCRQQFAKQWATAGKAAHKIMRGRVYVRGMTRK